ncbi:O-antigen translocase [Flavobacterium suncheonense]|uniref:Lipopolysaccharide biosynthesis protein n=1 Tax=Flavobacterium suncheonense GH29-5 = DSM 17707 TaxID=1121899 RepID=A0A0A2MCT7_9FLAO|nr:O-antigen translocase [Flavobacterium suncheonense]KGO90084.1 hypothetical protein Q764_03180 [Flavobacterium suncheonense GH29-5 = DSM 17707]
MSLNSLSVGLNFILGLVSVNIVAQLLGPSGMALMGSFRNFTALSKSFSSLGINASVVRLFVENKEDKQALTKIYSTFFWLLTLVSVFVGVMILLFSNPISNYLFSTSEYSFAVQLFGLLLPLFVLNAFWIAIYNGLQCFKNIVIIQMMSSVIVFVLTVSLIYYGKLTGALISIAVCDLIMFIITALFVYRNKSDFSFQLEKTISKPYLSVIGEFSKMALLSAVIVPVTLILIRNLIIDFQSVEKAGIWEAINRISGFYMMFFTSGLSLYYMPKLAELKTDAEFREELRYYFKTLIPLFTVVLILVYLLKDFIISVALTNEFKEVNSLMIWQLTGDFLRMITLAFGYQILVKTMTKKYIAVEVVFNLSYLVLSYFLMQTQQVEGVVKAYFIANFLSLIVVLLFFRKLFLSNN